VCHIVLQTCLQSAQRFISASPSLFGNLWTWTPVYDCLQDIAAEPKWYVQNELAVVILMIKHRVAINILIKLQGMSEQMAQQFIQRYHCAYS
jgi:hypothetical protein